jgi:bud site selection protein 20
MGQVQKRKKDRSKNKQYKKAKRTKRRTKDLDQIEDDVKKTEEIKGYKIAVDVEDVPGRGEFFCIHCDRYFISQKVLDNHMKSKPHKSRVRRLKLGAHTQEIADLAAGLMPSTTHKRK